MMSNDYSLDLSIIPKELGLLLEIMDMENAKGMSALENELFTEVDWELFLQLTMHHRVYPLVYLNLIKVDEKLIPQYIIQNLYQEYKKNTFQMLHLSREMGEVSKLFTENQIRLLFLKGPVIAADIYEDISLRTSKDLDILISISDYGRAEKILLNYGYEKREINTDKKMQKCMRHHETFYHPQKRIEIEMHWRLHPSPTEDISFKKLWERKRISQLTSYPVYYLGKEDLFSFLVAHGARHGWFRLRWLVDIDKILRKKSNFDEPDGLLLGYKL